TPRAVRGTERQHGFRHGLDERRSLSPAAERTFHCGIHAEHTALACGSERLSRSGPAGTVGEHRARRCVARTFQVLRWRANVAKHVAAGIPAGSNERTERPAFADSWFSGGSGSDGAAGDQRTLF